MKLCIDIQSAVSQRAGVGRYTRQLVAHLGSHVAASDILSLFYFDFNRRGEPFSAPGADLNALRWFPGRIAQAAWKTFDWPPYNWFAGSADLYHFPNFVAPPLRRGKSVVTIHDMSFHRHPEFTEAGNLAYLQAKLRQTAARVDAILTVSNFSAGEIEDTLGAPRDRIVPIHLGIGPEFAPPDPDSVPATLARHGIDGPYLLTVGTLEPRKNLPLLVDAFERLHDFDGQLVVVGMPGWKCEPIIERMRNSSRAAHIRRLGFVPDADLPALYAGAALFMFPSWYEGFGFTPLEAMACGAPVVASSGGSLEEVLGDGAWLLDPGDAEPWAEAARTLLADDERRAKLASAGRRRAATFTWSATAEKTWAVYQQVAG